MSEAINTDKRGHRYDAEATILEGHFRLPLEQTIKPQAYVKLPEKGGYLSQRAENYRLEGVLSFRSAYAQVAGNRSTKTDEGYSTLTTTVVEGLNVLDVLTADRVVGQTITEHPLEGKGYVPSISFLGTRFENLRIAGHQVRPEFDLGLFDSKPANDAGYTKDPGFIARVSSQHKRVRQHEDLPAEILDLYNHLPATSGSGAQKRETVECSLVNQADGSYPGVCFGHVIKIPRFGAIVLGRLTLIHEDFDLETDVPRKTTFRLTMIDLKLGCVADGSIPIGTGSSNGGGG